MTQKYYIRLDESLASKLKEMEREEIIDALETLAETEDEGDVDELAQYDRTDDIRKDDSISPEEKKRRLIRARRRGIPR